MGKVVAAVTFVLLAVALSLSAAKAEASATVWVQPYGQYYCNANPGKPCSFTVSSNRTPAWSVGNAQVRLTFQSDCNLVTYDYVIGAVWATNTEYWVGPCTMKGQTDGNWVIYDAYGIARWATNTYQYGNSEVVYARQWDFQYCGPDVVGYPHGVLTTRWASAPGC